MLNALMTAFDPSPEAVLRALEAAALSVVAVDPIQAVRLVLLAAEIRNGEKP